MRPSAFTLLGALLGILLLASCTSLPFRGERLRRPEDVPAALERAERRFAAGRTGEALEILRQARKVSGLPIEVRGQIDVGIERYADKRIEELSRPGSDPGELADLLELNLPRQLAVTAGVRAARMRLEEGRPYKAFKLIKKVDSQYPLHHERREAGEILARAGLALADDPWSFLGLFRRRDDGIEVLEYLVVNYPSEARCDEAYFKLGVVYAEDGLWDLARQRFEDLVLNYRGSPLAVQAEALIPRMRLLAIQSPEYDRSQLVKARVELETWLERHAGSDLEPSVRIDLADCLQRLVEGDLSIARFYHRVHRSFGARFHAQRALEVADRAGSERLVARAASMLERIPDVASLPRREVPVGSVQIDPEERLGLEGQEQEP